MLCVCYLFVPCVWCQFPCLGLVSVGVLKITPIKLLFLHGCKRIRRGKFDMELMPKETKSAGFELAC